MSALELQVARLLKDKENLEAQLATQALDANETQAEMQSKLEQALENVKKASSRARDTKKDKSVREIFDSMGFKMEFVGGEEIPKYILKKTFRQCLTLPAPDEGLTTHQRQIVKV